MLVKEKSMAPVSRRVELFVLCVCHRGYNGNPTTAISLHSQSLCMPNVIKGHLIGNILLIFKIVL